MTKQRDTKSVHITARIPADISQKCQWLADNLGMTRNAVICATLTAASKNAVPPNDTGIWAAAVGTIAERDRWDKTCVAYGMDARGLLNTLADAKLTD